MTQNPLINALAAVGYITLLAIALSTWATLTNTDPNPVAAIVAFLSIFVFSAAVMGYIVLAAPLRLFLEGNKKEGFALFGKTLLAFAVIAAIVFCVAFFLPSAWFADIQH